MANKMVIDTTNIINNVKNFSRMSVMKKLIQCLDLNKSEKVKLNGLIYQKTASIGVHYRLLIWEEPNKMNTLRMKYRKTFENPIDGEATREKRKEQI